MNIRSLLGYVSVSISLLANIGNAQVSEPVLAYIRHGEALRPIVGVPGAAYFGQAIDLGELRLAAVASEAAYAIGLTSDGTGVQLIRLRGTPPRNSTHVGTFASAVQDVRLSPNRTAAALTRSDTIEIIAGLPDGPIFKRSIPKAPDTRLLAVADDGEAVLIQESSGSAWLVDHNETRQVPAAALRDGAFLVGSHDLIYVDADVVSTMSATTIQLLIGPADVSGAQMARVSPNGRNLFTLNSGSNELLIARRPGGMIIARVALPCTASEVEWVHNSTVRLACASSTSNHLIEVSESGARLLFVPEPVE